MAPAEGEKRGGKEAKEELLNAICRLKLGTAGKATALLALVEYEQLQCLLHSSQPFAFSLMESVKALGPADVNF